MPSAKATGAAAPSAGPAAPTQENFRTRAARAKREKMRGRLLAATMEVCAGTNRRGTAVIDDVVKAAGVSRGAFYWYFDSLDEAIEMLGRQLADEMSAETAMLFVTGAGAQLHASKEARAVLRPALGGQFMMCRALMDPVWARYLSNVHVLLDDSQFVKAVRRNLELGRKEGVFNFESLTMVLDFQIGAVLGAVRRCTSNKPPTAAELVEMNVLILRGIGVSADAAAEYANQAARVVSEVAPGKVAWWNPAALKPPRPAKRPPG